MTRTSDVSEALATLQARWGAAAPRRGSELAGMVEGALAGCDKALATCATKFTNTLNFRGFPDMPGNDFLTNRASQRRIA